MNKIFRYLICLVWTLNSVWANSLLDESSDQLKKALIFGVTGQDGTYLAEFLLSKNYEVHGVARNSLSKANFVKIFTDHPQFFFHIGDITNYSDIIYLIGSIHPDEIYNLAAQTHVKASFKSPEQTAKINALGTLRILEAIRREGLEKTVKFFQAATSELFGHVQEYPQTEKTPFHPISPYGVAKLYAYWMTVNYREAYGIFGCNGILFNHESPLRGEDFVTRKITLAACRYKLGLQDVLYLGNLDVKRDWGYAKDYVEVMWLMLQQDQPDDYVISSGEVHSVREFTEIAFKELGIDIEWQGLGVEECGIDTATGKIVIKVDPKYYRINESNFLLGNADKAEKMLNWRPKTTFKKLIKMMVEADYKRIFDELIADEQTSQTDNF